MGHATPSSATSCESPRTSLLGHYNGEGKRAPWLMHQTWKTCDLPVAQTTWRARCAGILPHMRFLLWTDAHIRELVALDFPEHLPLYDSYDQHIKRVDVSRYFILFAFGAPRRVTQDAASDEAKSHPHPIPPRLWVLRLNSPGVLGRGRQSCI